MVIVMRIIPSHCAGPRDRAHAGKHAFVAFVDFSKAFDTIPRDLLWRRMQEIIVYIER
jgi:hypothetical protein